MNLREAFEVAVRSLRSNRLRSLLTTLGIIIGVAAVILLVALGKGMQKGVDEQFGRLANQITLSKANGTVPGGGTAKDLKDDDVTALQNRSLAPDIQSVTPQTQGSTLLTYQGQQERASVVGTTANYLRITDRSIAVGEFFNRTQERGNAKVAVLGQEAVGFLFGPNAQLADVVGQEVRVAHSTFRIIGVLAQDEQQDNVVIMPIGASRAYLLGGGSDNVDQIVVKATSPDAVGAATAQLTKILDDRHKIKDPKKRDYNVRAQQNLLNRRTEFVNFLTLFTAAVAAISLIVGGIGVANIMLVAVTERTREIGIRKAIGAPRSAIMKQFLTEAVVLSGLGGLAGVAVGIGLATAGGPLLHKVSSEFPQPVLTVPPILISFGVSLLIGLLAGGYPANRAARLRPIEALRFE
ncbi:MAG TPA: ABC transporter permease [Pseudonocardia sp.]|jgi:putative ABC transport system permease protein|nr:ABC transporter permease [Pseudonocardia sp.]